MFSHKSKVSSGAVNMCEGPIFPILLKVAIPLILTGILQQLFNTADMVVVGRFGSGKSLGAVGATGSLTSLIVNVFLGLSVGTNVVCAKFFGAKDERNMEKAVHTSVCISGIIGIFLTVVGFFSAEFLLRRMGTIEEVIDLSTVYMRIIFLGMIPTIVYNFASAILRAVGDTKRPLYYLTLAGAVNVVLNLLLVIVFKLDVAGVAIATVVSNTISALLCLRALIKSDGMTHLNLKKLRISGPTLGEIIRIGLPAGIQSTLFSISNVIITTSVNAIAATLPSSLMRTDFLNGSNASGNLEAFLFTAFAAINQSIIAFTGQNYGSRNYKRIVKSQIYGVLFTLIFGGAICFLMNHFTDVLLPLYGNTAAAVTFGERRFAVIGLLCFLYAISDVFVGGIRGCGYSFSTMISSVVCICGLRLLWIFTVFNPADEYAFEILFASYPISYVASIIVQGILLIFVLKRVKKKLSPANNQPILQ